MKKTKFLSVLLIIALVGLFVVPMMGCEELEITPELEELIREEAAKLQGEQGEPGPAGSAGPQGEQGPVGTQGEPGPAGPRGPAGSQGGQGSQGEPGPQGEVGPRGSSGSSGSDGSTGATGATGPQGEQGPAGEQGPPGESGVVSGAITVSYTTIQDAINAASPGATIIVPDGTYSATPDNSILLEDSEDHGYCFIHIDKAITLIGESRDGVILDGTGLQGEVRSTGIWVSVSNVTVKNLTIQNFEGSPNYSYGLYVMEKFRDYVWANVDPLQYVTAENVRVADCQASLYFMKTEYATVKDCIVENNTADGIWVAWGSHNATVQGNEVTNSGDHGIWVGSTWMGAGHVSNDAIIKGNTVNGARESGIWYAGAGCLIEDNEVTNIQGDPAGWSNGVVTLGVTEATSNVVVQYNRIHDNDTYGIGISAASDVTGTHINFNNIYNNVDFGLKNQTGVLVDATENWWGTVVEADILAMVSGDVDYGEWLLAPFE